MNRLGHSGLGVLALVLAGARTTALGQSVPAVGATAPTAVAATTEPAPRTTRPTVAELLPSKTATLNFDDATIPTIIDFISRTYGIEIVNKYELKGLVTMKSEHVTARQAINSLNSMIVGLGYNTVESVRGDPPRVVLTVVPTRSDAGSLIPMYYGSDPDKIPEGNEMRTQIMTFTGIDAEKARMYLSAVIGKQAEMQVTASTKTITLTDTSTHVHAAAALLQMLEKQAADHP
jgi:type II secretory pathway component GspD/PulD (secretin)